MIHTLNHHGQAHCQSQLRSLQGKGPATAATIREGAVGTRLSTCAVKSPKCVNTADIRTKLSTWSFRSPTY